MLEWIRTKIKNTVIWFIVGIISLVFLLGSGELFRKNINSIIVAEVNKQPIYKDTINAYYNQHLKQHANQKSYSKLDLDPKKIKNQILQEIINDEAILSNLKKIGFMITDEQLVATVKSLPYLQDNNRFSQEKYHNFLKHINFTELQYKQLLSKYLLKEQLSNSISLSNFVPEQEVKDFIINWKQTRDFGYLKIPANKFKIDNKTNINISQQEIVEYYNNNSSSFIQPETVKIAYLELDPFKFQENIIVNQEELIKYYQEHINYYTLPELVNVDYILIPNNTSDAKTKSEEALMQLKKGTDFNQLKKQYQGEETGWIGHGEIDHDFEKAAFALTNPGDLSNVVETKFGYHIIKLKAKRPATIRKFKEIITQVTEHYKEDISQDKFQTIIEQLDNGDLDHESLENIANKFDLTIEYAGPFTTNGEASGVASYNQTVLASFDPKNFNHNSKLINLTNNRSLILKTIEYNKQAKLNLEQAKPKIISKLQNDYAKQKTKNYGLAIAKELIKTNNSDKLINKITKKHNLTWHIVNKATRNMQVIKDNPQLNKELIKIAFSLNTHNKQKTFNDSNGDFIIIQLLNIHNITNQELDKESINQMTQQLMMLNANLEQQLFEQDLINTSKIKIFKQGPDL